MKKLILSFILLMVALGLRAQGDIEISGFGGYTFKNSFGIYGGSASIGAGPTYGGSFAFGVGMDTDVELYYSGQKSTFRAVSTIEDLDVRADGTVHYWMVGGVQNFQGMDPSLYFFGAFRVGGVTFSGPQENVTEFAASLGGGIKYFISDQVGIKISGNMLFPVMNVGAGLWFGPGGGGVGLSTWSPILQFNFNGGVFIRIMK